MSMQNFPRIPKITLRNSCDEYKDPKNENPLFCLKSTDDRSDPQLGDSFVHQCRVFGPRSRDEIHVQYALEQMGIRANGNMVPKQKTSKVR